MAQRASFSHREALSAAVLAASLLLCLLAGQFGGTALPAMSSESVYLKEYLSALGWQATGTPQLDSIELPSVFDESYDDYLSIQTEAGFDLTQYAGYTVTRYVYEVSNYPTGESPVYADLLVYDGVIIGGEIRSPDLNGFMQSLIYPRQDGA